MYRIFINLFIKNVHSYWLHQITNLINSVAGASGLGLRPRPRFFPVVGRLSQVALVPSILYGVESGFGSSRPHDTSGCILWRGLQKDSRSECRQWEDQSRPRESRSLQARTGRTTSLVAQQVRLFRRRYNCYLFLILFKLYQMAWKYCNIFCVVFVATFLNAVSVYWCYICDRRPDDWILSWGGSGQIWAWGHNHRGQLGGVEGAKVKLPAACEPLAILRPVQLVGGEQTLFAVTGDGKVSCSDFFFWFLIN